MIAAGRAPRRRRRRAPRGLVALTPGDHHRQRDVGTWLARLGEAGLQTAILREPHLDPVRYRALVEAARPVPNLILHARVAGAVELATRLGLGLHVPGHTDPTTLRSRVFGTLGVSCHDAREVDLALDGGADYATLSPVWRPTSKPGDRRPTLGPDRFLSIASGRTVLALGGVTPERFGDLVQRGAHGAAASGALFGVDTPDEAVEQLRRFQAAAAAAQKG